MNASYWKFSLIFGIVTHFSTALVLSGLKRLDHIRKTIPRDSPYFNLLRQSSGTKHSVEEINDVTESASLISRESLLYLSTIEMVAKSLTTILGNENVRVLNGSSFSNENVDLNAWITEQASKMNRTINMERNSSDSNEEIRLAELYLMNRHNFIMADDYSTLLRALSDPRLGEWAQVCYKSFTQFFNYDNAKFFFHGKWDVQIKKFVLLGMCELQFDTTKVTLHIQNVLAIPQIRHINHVSRDYFVVGLLPRHETNNIPPFDVVPLDIFRVNKDDSISLDFLPLRAKY